MISYDEALKIAMQRKDNIDNVTEYEKCFIFSAHEDDSYIGGYGHTPVVVCKDGEVINYTEALEWNLGKEIRRFDL